MGQTIILEQLELVAVAYEDAKVTLTFLDEAAAEIREVNFNKKVYDKATGKFSPDDAKAEQVEVWCEEYFGVPFAALESVIGVRKDVYVYDKFNSLFESTHREISKFDDSDVGQIYTGTISDVAIESEGIRVYIDFDEKTYRFNMGFTKKVGATYFVDPQKRGKQFDKFAEKFQIPASQGGELIGKSVMFEVKKMATGDGAIFLDVKPFPKPKAKK